MLEQPRRTAPEDAWSEEDKEEIEALIRSRGPARPRVVINQHQRDVEGSKEQEEQQRAALEALRERQKDLKNHPWVLAPWELPGRRGKIGMKNVRGQAMAALTRTYDELEAEVQPERRAGTAPEQARSSPSELDDAEAENPAAGEEDDERTMREFTREHSTATGSICGPSRSGGFSNRRPFQFDPSESVFNN